jgi:hypothetical protein
VKATMRYHYRCLTVTHLCVVANWLTRRK